ncbi:TetR family transcriptional regulator [Mycobacterium sp. ACS1612]|uniref:TetR family transcriptional regulator n=1 Tax=Mycobacterium sp. ACS1612 TaxID=1834117 RepID=UPI0007FB7F61|nr:TetR family transcriptional regulator [Mycobacterium sp. ACS1612]OBF33634.1 TetR family transcriptional regulator [Mycobacterium sp. ACS1612]
MSRWQPNARGRLEEAALELYAERGFDETTVAEIAERAGLTERTFFRHFTDKREVLFGGQDALVELIDATIAQASKSASPIDAAGDALRAVGEMLEGRREQARRRQTVIDANPGLQERELIKLASLAEAIAAALRRRGVAESAAALTAETAIAVFKVAYNRWLTAARRKDLPRLLGDSLDELKGLTGHASRA